MTIFYYNNSWIKYIKISRFITLSRFLGCLQRKKKHTCGGVKTHSTKLLKVITKNKWIIVNLIVLHKKQSSMLDLQAVDLIANKENFPLLLIHKAKD
jgi:hypothetical protein